MKHHCTLHRISHTIVKFTSRVFLILTLTIGTLVLTPPQSVYAAGTFVVNRTDDPAPRGTGTTCITPASTDCSLREAVLKANVNPGSTIQFTSSLNMYPIILTRSGNDDTAQLGDLDIIASVSIEGNGPSNTLIQGSMDELFNVSMGDKIFSVNQSGLYNNLTVNFSGLTLRYGNNQNPSTGSFSELGGAMDIFQTGAGNAVTITDCVISNNRVAVGYGGAISYDALETGSLTITNSIFNQNSSLTHSGGAIASSGVGSTLSISNSTFTNNTAAKNGGGITVSQGRVSISNSLINGNRTSSGLNFGGGIYIASSTLSAQITGSQITNNFAGGGGGGIAADAPTTISNCRIANNTASMGGEGLDTSAAAVITATNNWWGCSAGPSAAACDSIVIGSGTVTSNPWLQDRLTADPSPLVVNQSTELTASFLTDSAGSAIPITNLNQLISLPVTWSASNGTLTGSQTAVQSNGMATSTFQATSAGSAVIYAKVDNDATAPSSSNVISLTVNKADTTAAISSTTPNPSLPGDAVTVNYSVSGAYGNSPTAPTGDVTVSDGAGNTCTGSVAAGSCSITFASTGTKLLTATYAGDANFIASPASAGISHVVRTPLTLTSFTLQVPAASSTHADELVFRATFSVAAQNVDVTDFAVNGTTTATVTDVSAVSTSLYDVTISGGDLASLNGIIGLDLSGSQNISDMDDNSLPAGEPTIDQTYDVDNTAPILHSFTRQTPAGSLTYADTLVFRVTMDSAVLNVDATDFVVAGSSTATVTLVALVSDGVYDVTVSGGNLASFNGTVGLNLGIGQDITDAAGNPLPDGDPSTDEDYLLDNTIPSVAMSSSAATATRISPIPVTVTFSESVTGFSSGEIIPGNGTVSNFTGSGADYTFELIPGAQGTVTADIAANVAADPTGNSNTAAAQFSREYDSINPTVTINQASAQSDPTGSSPINFTVVFDETVTGFTDDDISLSGSAGATTASVSGSGTTYNVAVSGMSMDGNVTADVLAGGVQDAAGNTNTASTSSDNQVAFDANRPSVAVSSTTTSPIQTSPISVTITFNESVTGFTPTTVSGDLILTNGTGSNPAGSGTTYTFDLTPSGEGAVTVIVPDGSAQDLAGNLNTVSNTFSITYDTVDPTVTIEQAATQADPSNAGTINFTATFSEPVTDFESSDVTLGGTAGATTAIVTGSGATYNVAVSGMTMNGTVSATLAAGRAQDAALNPSEASTSSDNEVTYIVGPLDVSINQAAGQTDPSNALPVNFTVVFGRAIDLATFTSADITLGGTAPGTPAATISEIAPNNGTTFNVAVDGLSGTGTVTASIAANSVQDPASNENTASITTDASVTYDPGVPTISSTNLQPTLAPSLTSIIVNFSEAVYDNPLSDTETDDVTNPANYFLFEKGANGVSERTACNGTPPVTSDDIYISIDQVVYDNTAFTATLSINSGVALPVGQYELFVCGTTSILDLAGNAINNGLSDYTYEFRVIAAGSGTNLLPVTGFAPNRMTHLPTQPAWKAYSNSSLWLEIPALSLQQSIVGVPEAEGWDVTWLGDQIGYLGGTAFPTWAGNSVLTGHATNAIGEPGPFAALGNLHWGDQIVIHAFGQQYVYEVRSVNRLTNPKDTSALNKHEDLPWVTLISCNGYDEKTGTYRWRTVVRAVQIKVVDEE